MEEKTKSNSSIKKVDIKLLVVDDREDNLFSMETILEKDGYIIKTANSGRAALRTLLKEHDFTLILMDVQMPDLNGFETAELIYERDRLKHIPIIFITANDFAEENVFKGYRMGGIDYISKPINPELLRAKVSVFVELYRKNYELKAQEQRLIVANEVLENEITERKNSENKVQVLNQQLLDNIQQLKSTNEELERFAYVASHDLQEPLRKIRLFGDRLEVKYKPVLEGEGMDFLQKIIKASERMQILIKNILAYSKSSVNADAFEETDLNVLVNDILSDLEVYIKQKDAIINISKLPSLNIIPNQFRQLLQNLIINALKFNKENQPPEIKISAEIAKEVSISGIQSKTSEDGFCNIYISDNGIGFEQKYAEQIFTLFKRLHSYDQYEGTGIGLSVCKKIVEKHNGFISAVGEINKGATFIVSLPVKKQNAIEQFA
ncbi:MAG TPA: response regulator [Flavipsychrobacter sp.]|nr:response regulator [Flavipsychrobacter sp.]